MSEFESSNFDLNSDEKKARKMYEKNELNEKLEELMKENLLH